MNIKKIDIYALNVGIKIPINTPLGAIDKAENVAIKITTDNDIFGWGEASPCAMITGDTQESNYAMAQVMARLILGKNALGIESRMNEINSITVGD